MESLYTRPLESIPVENWLLELRMECYRRNLEEYPNLQTLVQLKDVDFKKLGILNAKDRATMMGSLDQFRLTLKTQGYGSRTIAQQEGLKKGSTKKIKKLKGLLGGGIKGPHKNKKGQDIKITNPQLSLDEGLHSIPEAKPSRGEEISQIVPSLQSHRQYLSSSFEDLIQKAIYTIENDYVPDPQVSPQFHRIPLQRSYTVSEPQPTRMSTTHSVDNEEELPDGAYGRMYTTNNKHLSVVSMESGLGLTCDADERDDFNRSLPLEQQPWFYGMMRRNDVEPLLDEDGDFLVTEDPISCGVYTLSMQWDGRCFHLPVNCNEVVMKGLGGTMVTGYKYLFDNGAFDSVPELIYNHLRYNIPINSDLGGIIINPVNRINNKIGFASHDNLSLQRPYGTLPRNFGRSVESNLQRQSVSPEYMTLGREKRGSLRGARSMSLSPINNDDKSHHVSNTTLQRASSSSTNIVMRDLYDEDEMSNLTMASIYQDVPSSPKPVIEEEEIVRPRTISPYSMASSDRESKTVSVGSCHEPDDYEVMGSVSIRNTLPPSPILTRAALSPRGRSPSIDSHYSTVIPRTLRHEQSYPTVQHNSAGVKYAEISFNRASSTSAVIRNDSMRSRAQTVTYVSPRVIRDEVAAMQQSTPHPFSTYSQLTKSRSSSSRNSPSSSSNTYGRPSSNRSSTESPYSSRPPSVIGRGFKAPQTVSEIPSFLKEFTNEEIATHLTKADAVCFLLAPRPGENYDLWKNRVQELNTESGVLIGLEVLAAKTGEKLWKKLFYRHLGISQLVTVSLIHTGETVERAKLLRRWIELANLLQNGNYGNLFSFMAILKGLESPQVIDMKNTWNLLKTHYSDTFDVYDRTLKGMILALNEGASIYAIEQLTIPAIQHLRKLYTDDTHCNTSEDTRLILEDFTTRTVGLDGLHSIVSHTADLSINAKRRFGSYSYNSLLFDFLMQDCARIHLQNMGTSSDDPLERYRRFNIVLDAMMSKLDNP